jgi:hypothetical protein
VTRNGIFGKMVVREESMFCPSPVIFIDYLLIASRLPHEVTKRLDKLILQIREIQKPYMLGEEPADVLLVRFLSRSSLLYEYYLNFTHSG